MSAIDHDNDVRAGVSASSAVQVNAERVAPAASEVVPEAVLRSAADDGAELHAAATEVVRGGLLEQRLLLGLPVHPFVAGLSISLLLFLSSGLPNLLYHEAFASAAANTPVDRLQGYFTDEGTWSALVWSLLLGYTLAAITHLPVKAVADTLRALKHVPPELAAAPERFVGLGAETIARSRRAGLVWATLGLLGLLRSSWLLLAPESVVDFVLPFLVRFAWFIVVVPFTCFVIGRAAYISVNTSRAGEHQLLHMLRFHVLDPSPFDGLVRMAIRTAAAWIGGATLLSLFLFNVPWRYLGATIPLALASCAMAAVAIWTPLLGVNRRMRELKRSELSRLLLEIERDRSALALQPGGAHVGADVAPRLAALLAYREAVRAAPEWPIGITNGGRILFLTILPVLGWICAALVERLLSVVL